MGDNTSFSVLEEQVISVSKSNIELTPELLDLIAKPFDQTDIDDGGYQGLTDNENRDFYQIAILTYYPDFVPNPPDEDDYFREEIHTTYESEYSDKVMPRWWNVGWG